MADKKTSLVQSVTPDIDEVPVKPRISRRKTISKRLTRMSLNRLSLLVSPKRRSLIKDNLFPKMPYFNISHDIVEEELDIEQETKILEDEMEYLPDPINPVIVDKVISAMATAVDDNDRYFYTHLYETTIRSHLKQLKGSANDTKAYDELEQTHSDILQQFDNPLTRSFSRQYDQDFNDFDKFERKTKREVLLQSLTEDACELRKITKANGLVNVASVEDLHSRFYADEDPVASMAKPAKITNKLFAHSTGSSSTLVYLASKNNSRSSIASSTKTIDVDMPDALSDTETVIFDDIQSEKTTDIESQQPPKKPNQLRRNLTTRTLQMIAFGSALGNGLLLNSGKNFTISGPLGTLLGFTCAGSVVLATMLSYCEVVSILPVADGLSGLTSRFVDDAYGFTLGWGYWLAFAVSLPSEIVAAIIMLSSYDLDIPSSSTAAWIVFFIATILAINLFDVRVFGEVEYVTNIIKVLFMVVISIVCVVINTGGSPAHTVYGTRFWKSEQSLDGVASYGPFRPTYDLADTGEGAFGGISGATGRFLAVITSTSIAAYAYCGTEIVCIAAGEAKNPHKSLPSATKKVFWRILFFYILGVFLVGLNIYSGDARLLRIYSNHLLPGTTEYVQQESAALVAQGIKVCATTHPSGIFSNSNKSPWVIAAQSVGMCNFASAVNGFIVFFALSSGSSQLYASSRTLYALAIQNKAPRIFARCLDSGVPFVSVLFTALFACLAFVAVSEHAAVAFQTLATITLTFVLLAWGGMCLSFIRFYYALQLRPDIVSRNDPHYPFKSPLQPYLAYYGLVGSTLFVLFLGISVFFGQFTWEMFLSSYGSVVIFVAVYCLYKFFYKTRVKKLDQIDLDTGRKESHREDWSEAKMYKNTKTDWLKKARSYIF